MKNGRKEEIRYTIERKFLAKITAEELVSRIIQYHIKDQPAKEA